MSAVIEMGLIALASAAGVLGAITGNLAALFVALCAVWYWSAYASRRGNRNTGLWRSLAAPLSARRDCSPISQRWLGPVRPRGPVVFLLLLASLAGSVAAAWLAYGHSYNALSPALWIGSMAGAACSAAIYDRLDAQISRIGSTLRMFLGNKRAARELVFVSLLTGLAFVLRAYELGVLPPMHGDEGEMGMLALHVLTGNNPVPPFSTAFLDHPTLFHYLQAFSMSLFGQSVVGLRMLTVLFGVSCVPLVYLLGRKIWGPLAGATGAWLLTVSHLHIHYSRMALNNIESVWCMLVVLLLLSPKRRSGHSEPTSLSSCIWAGIVIGLSQYFYFGSRLIPFVALAVAAAGWYEWRERAVQVGAMALAGAVAYLPLGWHYWFDSSAFGTRLNRVNAMTPEYMHAILGPHAVWTLDLPRLILYQVHQNMLFFVNHGDVSSFYWGDLPGFDWVTVTLFWLGIGVVIARRGVSEWMITVWFVLGVGLGGVLTTGPAYGPRLLITTPAVYLVAGLFVQQIGDRVNTDLIGLDQSWRPTRLAFAFPAVLITGAIATFLLNTHMYFIEYAARIPGSAPFWVAAVIADNAREYDAFLFGAPRFGVEHGVIRFIDRNAHVEDLDRPGALPQQLPDGKGRLVVVLPHRIDDMESLARKFPGGKRTYFQDPAGELIFGAYWLAPSPSFPDSTNMRDLSQIAVAPVLHNLPIWTSTKPASTNP